MEHETHLVCLAGSRRKNVTRFCRAEIIQCIATFPATCNNDRRVTKRRVPVVSRRGRFVPAEVYSRSDTLTGVICIEDSSSGRDTITGFVLERLARLECLGSVAPGTAMGVQRRHVPLHFTGERWGLNSHVLCVGGMRECDRRYTGNTSYLARRHIATCRERARWHSAAAHKQLQ